MTIRARLRARNPRSAALVVVGLALTPMLLAIGGSHGHGHASGQVTGAWLQAAHGGMMMAAMMLPLAAGDVVLIEERSLRRRRWRTVAEHVTAFAAVWFAFGAAMTLILHPFVVVLGSAPAFAASAVIAVVWQLSRRRRVLMTHGALGLAPMSGWMADMGTLRGGVSAATRCGATCWASMVALGLATTPLVAVAWVGVFYWEWLPGPDPHGRRRRMVPAVCYAVLASLVLAAAIQRPS